MKSRKVKKLDLEQLVELYKKSAAIKEGLARNPNEITPEYMNEILKKTLNGGLGILIEDENHKIVGAMLSFQHGPEAFKHTLGNMTMAVDPNYFGKGLGKRIFVDFVTELAKNRPDIARAELQVRQNNQLAIKIYESVGFVIEGVQKNRILDAQGRLSSDVMMAWYNPNFKY